MGNFFDTESEISIIVRTSALFHLPPYPTRFSMRPDSRLVRMHDYRKPPRSLFSTNDLGALYKDAAPRHSKSNPRSGRQDFAHITIGWKECDQASAVAPRLITGGTTAWGIERPAAGLRDEVLTGSVLWMDRLSAWHLVLLFGRIPWRLDAPREWRHSFRHHAMQ